MTFKEITVIHCTISYDLIKYPKNWEVVNVPLLPPDAHGGYSQSRGSGDAYCLGMG